MRPGQYFISTHAFTEGDGIACINANRLKYFNSRLHGRRQFFSHIRHSASLFQLTPSRKATRSRATTMSKSEISTHAFTEGDYEAMNGNGIKVEISTHAFTEGDLIAGVLLSQNYISTHAFTEGDT